MWIGSLGPRTFWGTRATNFSIYTTKMEGAGPNILGTGAKFKQVPCQKNCRVNRALVCKFALGSARFHRSPSSYTKVFFRKIFSMTVKGLVGMELEEEKT